VSSTNGFISKLDSGGNFVWAKQIGPGLTAFAVSVSLDAAGNVYTTGSFQGTIDFDPGPGTYFLTASGFIEAFISKLDSGGNFVWAKQLGGSGDAETEATLVSLDAAGNIYTAGDFNGIVDFDPGPGSYNLATAASSPGHDGFVSKLDSGGNFVWAGQFGGGDDATVVYGLSLDTSDNLYAVAGFSGTADFDPGPGANNLTSADGAAVILKLKPCSLQPWYRDADGDGYGSQALSTQSCPDAQPAGFVANSLDCNDANPAIYPGAPEENDGVDNQCSGDPGYGIIDEINGTVQVGAGGTVCFSDTSGATSYEVARSSDRTFSTCVILETVSAGSQCLTDPTNPSSGSGFYYLVRAVAPYAGSWGEDSAGHEHILSCSGGCIANAQCDDGNPCTSDVCDATSHCVHQNIAGSCSDGNACTTNDSCTGGVCVGGATLDCNDGVACTIDSCSPATGCVHAANNTLCDDAQSCTTDTCNPLSGCAHATLPNGTACGDSNACTANDQCSAGVCAGQAPAVANHLVLSQFTLRGGGGESDEFVEIYNPSGPAVSLSGQSLQYKHQGSGGAGYQMFTFPALSVPSHGWFLVVGSGYTGAVTADAVNSGFQADSSADGTWYLVSNVALLSGTCPGSGSIIDKVAWGTAGSGVCPEGNTTNAPTGTTSQQRLPGGACGDGQDTDNNAADFVTLTTSSPHNRFSPPQP
jgi:hypothetical protein